MCKMIQCIAVVLKRELIDLYVAYLKAHSVTMLTYLTFQNWPNGWFMLEDYNR